MEKIHKMQNDHRYHTEKLADLEDCSHRNNIRVCGVPESHEELPEYLQQLFHAIWLNLEKANLRPNVMSIGYPSPKSWRRM
ncbi:Hypothetical predicted protein [Pelobates cultripes]|uniref:Uncharacterized protein n=1 Tax=Pelobates cultripes TaxID=61616 RepID=A0AAD1RUV2_PELCU|nr:Hypothetical predicted protein [Pelobates cultripes]